MDRTDQDLKPGAPEPSSRSVVIALGMAFLLIAVFELLNMPSAGATLS